MNQKLTFIGGGPKDRTFMEVRITGRRMVIYKQKNFLINADKWLLVNDHIYSSNALWKKELKRIREGWHIIDPNKWGITKLEGITNDKR